MRKATDLEQYVISYDVMEQFGNSLQTAETIIEELQDLIKHMPDESEVWEGEARSIISGARYKEDRLEGIQESTKLLARIQNREKIS